MTSIVLKISVWQQYPLENVERGEIEEALKNVKLEKAPGMGGITDVLCMCNLIWEQGEVPEGKPSLCCYTKEMGVRMIVIVIGELAHSLPGNVLWKGLNERM